MKKTKIDKYLIDSKTDLRATMKKLDESQTKILFIVKFIDTKFMH